MSGLSRRGGRCVLPRIRGEVCKTVDGRNGYAHTISSKGVQAECAGGLASQWRDGGGRVVVVVVR